MHIRDKKFTFYRIFRICPIAIAQHDALFDRELDEFVGLHERLSHYTNDGGNEGYFIPYMQKGVVAYQCLGYLLVKEGETSASTNILRKYDYYFSEYVYSKLFLDLTEKERNIAYYLAINGDSDNTKLIEAGLVSGKTISVYKESLSKKGVLDVSTRGMNKLALPRFGEFVKFRMESID